MKLSLHRDSLGHRVPGTRFALYTHEQVRPGVGRGVVGEECGEACVETLVEMGGWGRGKW